MHVFSTVTFRRVSIGSALAYLVLAASTSLYASTISPLISQMCDDAALRASKRSGVPVSVLKAITRVETGRHQHGSLRPWPWTINSEGAGQWFSDRKQARDFAIERIALGLRSFDLGCFQLNFRWHGAAFDSLDAMLDPDLSAAYAAGFLKDLYLETGNWPAAAAAYHSRTPKYANRYRKKFEQVFAELDFGSGDQNVKENIATAQTAALNTYPFFTRKPEIRGQLGSLVPPETKSTRPFVKLSSAQ